MEFNNSDLNKQEPNERPVEMTDEHELFVELQLRIERAQEEIGELQRLRQDEQITHDYHDSRKDLLTYLISKWQSDLDAVSGRPAEPTTLRGRVSSAFSALFRKHPPAE